MKSIFSIVMSLQLIPVLNAVAQTKTEKEFYKNGTIQSIKHQGFFMGCGVPVGADSLFNKKGKLTETSEYVHIKDEEGQSCHAITTYMKKSIYKAANTKPDIQYYKIGYQSESVSCDEKSYMAAKERYAVYH